MKIGTVTFHRANNYGAVLQAYALYRYLANMGFDAEVIDYWPQYHSYMYSFKGYIFNSIRNKKGIKKVISLLVHLFLLPKLWLRKRKFDKFRKDYIKIGGGIGNESYDSVFYGSDTIWNIWKHNNLFSGFDPVLWGSSEIKSKYKFSYAPSMGDVIDSEETYKFCQAMLPNFKLLSVRESFFAEKLREWGWNNVTKVLDPTFLLTKQQWESITPFQLIKGDYVVCYNLENSDVIVKIAETLKSEYQIRVIFITGSVTRHMSRDVKDLIGPLEFLSLLKHAKYVLTSSFHGVVFSIIFEKKFCFHSQKETERILSLLDLCNLSSRYVRKADINLLEAPIDYSDVEKRLYDMRIESYRFIKRCLEIV